MDTSTVELAKQTLTRGGTIYLDTHQLSYLLRGCPINVRSNHSVPNTSPMLLATNSRWAERRPLQTQSYSVSLREDS